MLDSLAVRQKPLRAVSKTINWCLHSILGSTIYFFIRTWCRAFVSVTTLLNKQPSHHIGSNPALVKANQSSSTATGFVAGKLHRLTAICTPHPQIPTVPAKSSPFADHVRFLAIDPQNFSKGWSATITNTVIRLYAYICI